MAEHDSHPRRAALLGGLVAGAALGTIVGAATVHTNGSIDRGRDAVVFALWCAAAYAALALPLAAASALLFARRGARPFGASALAVAFALGGYAAGSRAAALGAPWVTEVHLRACAAGLAGAVVAWLGVQVALRRRSPVFPAVLLVALALVALASVAVPRPRPTDPRPSAPLTAAADAGRVVLVGVDGADWRHLQPLLDAGRLPAWERLLRSGVSAPLTNQVPTWSPVIWNTVATGLPGSEHGILDFTAVDVPGLARAVQRLRVVPRLALNPLPDGAPVPPHVGLAPLVDLLVAHGVLREAPVHGGLRRAKALRNVLSEAGLEVASVRWWASWPAEEVNGRIVADAGARHAAARRRDSGAGAPGVTYPPELLDELAAIEGFEADRVWDDDDPAGSVERALADPLFADLDGPLTAVLRERPDVVRLVWNTALDDRFGVAAARAFLDRPEVDYLEVYTCLVDVLGHKLEGLARRDPAWQALIERGYEESDAQLARLLEADDGRTTWIVVSDHGWSYDATLWGHYHAPTGVFLASGAGLAEGAELARPPSILDVAPTVLALFGLPASEAMPGAPLVDVLAADRATPARVATLGAYRPRWPRVGTTGSAEAGAAEIERLRELGYVQ